MGVGKSAAAAAHARTYCRSKQASHYALRYICIGFVGLAAAVSVFEANADEKRWSDIGGLGTAPCAAYLEAVKTSDTERASKSSVDTQQGPREPFQQWVLGYVSGSNAFRMSGSKGSNVDVTEITDTVTKYCRAHPDDPLVVAANMFVATNRKPR